MHGRSFPVDCEPDNYPVTDDAGNVVAYDLHPPEHYRQMRGLPSVEEVAAKIEAYLKRVTIPAGGPFAEPIGITPHQLAREWLALLDAVAPRIKAEALREAAVLFEADFCGVTLTLRALADQIEGATA